MRGALFAALAACAGCLGDVSDIPCESDDTCPTAYWCNGAGTCTPNATAGPPLLELDGVRRSDGDPIGKSVTLPPSGSSIFTLQVGNYGQSEAAYPTITLDGPACLGVNGTLPNNTIGILAQGDRTDQEVFADPTNCTSPATVAVHLSIMSGSASNYFVRKFSDGSFQVVLSP